jgi:predicted nucleic acid-binding protein
VAFTSATISWAGDTRRRRRDGTASVTDHHESGVLDTSAYLDLALLDPASLPSIPELTAITMAELHQGVAMAKDAANRAARTEKLGAAIVEFEPLPFDGPAAVRYGPWLR